MYELFIYVGFALLMLFVGFIVWDWGRVWYQERRYGKIFHRLNGAYVLATELSRWEHSYLGYKVWTWVVFVSTWFIAVWHAWLAALWLADAWFWIYTP